MKSNRIVNMAPSATIELASIVADLTAKGVEIISLNTGEPDFDTPQNIVDACKAALDQGKTRYCKVSGIAPIREAIAEKLQKDNNVTYTPDQIVVSTGAKQALNNALLAVCNPGDEIIIPIPCWVSYVEIVKLADGVPVLVPTDPSTFALDLDAIEAAITPKTRAIMINTPNNPTGAVYPEADLRRLGELAVKHDFYIISDEVYEKLVYGDATHCCVAALSPEIWDKSIIVNGLSKAYAMTGWRLGYSAANDEVTRSIASLQGHTTSNSTTFVQWAGIEALTGPQQSIEDMRQQFDLRRNYLLGRLRAMEGLVCPDAQGAFYLMPDVTSYYGSITPEGKEITGGTALCNYILSQAHVAVVAGDGFECPSCIRIAYSNSMENLEKAMDALEAALKLLKKPE